MRRYYPGAEFLGYVGDAGAVDVFSPFLYYGMAFSDVLVVKPPGKTC